MSSVRCSVLLCKTKRDRKSLPVSPASVTSWPITRRESLLSISYWPTLSLGSAFYQGQTQKACLIGLKLGFGVLQGVQRTPKTSNGSDLVIWFRRYVYSKKNMIMHIFSINFQHCYHSTYSWDINLILYLQWHHLCEFFRVPGIMFVDKIKTPMWLQKPITSYVLSTYKVSMMVWTTHDQRHNPFIGICCSLKERVVLCFPEQL